MKNYFKSISLLLALIVAVFGNPYPFYRAFNESMSATLYLDTVDQDEDLFIHVQHDADPLQQTLVHHEESSRDMGSKSKLLKTKLHLFLSFFRIGNGIQFEYGFPMISVIPTSQDVFILIFHPPNYSA